MIERPHDRDLTASELLAYVEALAASPRAGRTSSTTTATGASTSSWQRDDHLAVWLICWMDEQDTGFHDHDLSSGAVAVCTGALREDRLALGRTPTSRTVRAGGSFGFSAADIHRVSHAGAVPAVSLHAYSPPLWRMGAYEIGAGGELRRHSVSYAEELRPLEEPVSPSRRPAVPAHAARYGGRVILRQVTHDDLGCASYLIGDDDAGVAAVVDPRLDVDVYLRLARYLDVRIAHVLETHTHADHVSGHGRLAAATGAVIHVHREAGAAFAHEPFDDGWELGLGSLRVTALHTPGHRPEHTAFLLTDTARGEEPWAVLTGDSLFVGDIARPDLAIDREDGARDIFRSLHERLLPLGDAVEIWPGHLGGSMCGGPGMDMKIASTVGFERAHNALLAETDADALRASGRSPASAPSRRTSRRSSSSTAGRCATTRVEPAPLTAAPGGGAAGAGRAAGRRAHRPAVRRGPRPRRGEHHRAAGRLRLAPGVDRRARRDRRADRRRRRGSPHGRASSRRRSASRTSRARCAAG